MIATNTGRVPRSSNFVRWGETTEDVRGLSGLQMLFALAVGIVVLVLFSWFEMGIQRNAEGREEIESFWRLQQNPYNQRTIATLASNPVPTPSLPLLLTALEAEVYFHHILKPFLAIWFLES